MTITTTNTIKCIVATIGTALTFLFGGWDIAVIVLVVFIGIDYLSGLAVAIVNRNLSSAIGFRGLLKKVFILSIVIITVLVDRLLNSGTQVWILRTAICYFYIANEGISIIENASMLGIPIPKKLLDILVQLKKEETEET